MPYPKSEGVFFINNDKQIEKHPDYRGNIVVSPDQIRMLIEMSKAGLEPKLQIAGWNRTSKTDQYYMYISTEAYMKQEQQPYPPQQVQQGAPPQVTQPPAPMQAPPQPVQPQYPQQPAPTQAPPQAFAPVQQPPQPVQPPAPVTQQPVAPVPLAPAVDEFDEDDIPF